MRNLLFASIILVNTLFAASLYVFAAESRTSSKDLELSPDVLELLRAEMGEIAVAVQGIALSLAIADWGSIQETSKKIQASYIIEKKLTAAQAKELEQALPEHFKQLDTEFHQRAEKLGEAAGAHDPALVAFQYSRLIENCTQCHSAYAKSRFPGFTAPDQQSHSH